MLVKARNLDLILTRIIRRWGINSRTFHKPLSILWLGLYWVLMVSIALVGLTPAMPSAGGWRVVRGQPAEPTDRIGLWVGGAAPYLLWPGPPAMPNLRLSTGMGDPIRLPLGIRPGAAQLYPLANGYKQALWLDRALPGQGRLVGGTLDERDEVRRGPTAISLAAALEFDAAPTADGDLWVIWAEARRDGGTTPLRYTRIDALGRPQQPGLLAPQGRHPRLLIAPDGALHVAWLENSGGRLWTVRYQALPRRNIASGGLADAPAAGVIRLGADEALAALALSVSGAPQTVRIAWERQRIRRDRLTTRVEGLVFALGNLQAVRTLPVDGGGENLSRPILLEGLLVAHYADAQAGIFTQAFAPEGWVERWPLEGQIGPLNAAIDAMGRLYVAWIADGPDGSSTAYLAQYQR